MNRYKDKHYEADKNSLYIYTNKEENDKMELYKIAKKEVLFIRYNNQIYYDLDDIPNKEQFIDKIGSKNDALPVTKETKIERLNNERLKYYITEALKLHKHENFDFRFCKDKDLQIKGVDIIVLVKDRDKKFFVCVDAKTTIKYINRFNLYTELFQNCQNDIWQRGSALTQGICKHHYLMFSDEFNCYLITKNKHNIGVFQDTAVLHKHCFVSNDKNSRHQKRNDKYCMIIGEEVNKESFNRLDKLVFKRFVNYTDYENNKIEYRLARVFDSTNFIDNRLKVLSEEAKIIISSDQLSEEEDYSFIYDKNDTLEELVYKLIQFDMLENEAKYLYQYVEDCECNKQNIIEFLNTEKLAKYFTEKLINTYLGHFSKL